MNQNLTTYIVQILHCELSKSKIIRLLQLASRAVTVRQVKNGFWALNRKLLINLKISRQFRNGKYMIYNFVYRRCLRNLTWNEKKWSFYEFFTKTIHFFFNFPIFSLKKEKSELISNFPLKNMNFCKNWWND